MFVVLLALTLVLGVPGIYIANTVLTVKNINKKGYTHPWIWGIASLFFFPFTSVISFLLPDKTLVQDKFEVEYSIDEAKEIPPYIPPTPPTLSLEMKEKLKMYEQLYADGILNEEDFILEKERIYKTLES